MQKLRTFFLVLRQSLTNLDYYQEAKDVSFGFAGKYFLALLFLTAFVAILPLVWQMVEAAPKIPALAGQTETFLEKAYPRDLKIVIQKGQLSTNVTEPYFLPSPQGGKALAVIDTKANLEDFVRYRAQAYTLVTKNALVFPKNQDQETDVFFWSQLQEDTSLDYAVYSQAVSGLRPILANAKNLWWALSVSLLILGPVVATPFMALEKTISLAVLSAIFYPVIRKKFTFSQIFKVSLFASTLPIVFFTFLGLFSLTPTIPLGYTLTLGLFMGTIFYHLWKKGS
jgi:hypothetical protein